MKEGIDIIIKYFPVFLPLIVIELALALTALVHVVRHPHYRFGNKVVWILVVLLIQFIGPVLYFGIGRGDE